MSRVVLAIVAIIFKSTQVSMESSLLTLTPITSECRGETVVPQNFSMDPLEKYQFAESTLQIFTELRIPCDGLLTSWKFQAKNPIVSGLHLAVFRPRKPLTDAYEIEHGNRTVFDVVGESYLRALAAPNGMYNAWIYFPVERPIAVAVGDVLGFYYDSYRYSHDMLTVSSKSRFDLKSQTLRPTFVMMLDDSTLARNKTIDTRNAVFDRREPALAATIVSQLKPPLTIVSSSAKIDLVGNSRLINNQVVPRPSHKIEQEIVRQPFLTTSSPVNSTVTLTSTILGVSTTTPQVYIRQRHSARPVLLDSMVATPPTPAFSSILLNDRKQSVLRLNHRSFRGPYHYGSPNQHFNNKPTNATTLLVGKELDQIQQYVGSMKLAPVVFQNKSSVGDRAIMRTRDGKNALIRINEDYFIRETNVNDKQSTTAPPMPPYYRFATTVRVYTPFVNTEKPQIMRKAGSSSNSTKTFAKSSSEGSKILNFKSGELLVPTIVQEILNAVPPVEPSSAKVIDALQMKMTDEFDRLPDACLSPPTALYECKNKKLRVYFDYEAAVCRMFFGCESWDTESANNFATVTECRRRCKRFDRKKKRDLLRSTTTTSTTMATLKRSKS